MPSFAGGPGPGRHVDEIERSSPGPRTKPDIGVPVFNGREKETDIKKMAKLVCIQGQIAAEQAYVAYSDARIRSGEYKNTVIHIGGHDGPVMDEHQLLKRELGIMFNHIRRINDLAEAALDV